MNSPLEPNRVEVPDVLFWMRETVSLFRRKALLFISLSLAFFYICLKMQMNGYLSFAAGLMLCQAVLVLSIEFARCADESRPLSLQRCYNSMQGSVLVIVLMGGFYILMWLVAARIASLLMVEELMAESNAPPAISFLQWLYPGTVGFFVVYIGIMITTMWFLLPLTVFHRLGFIDSLKLAKHGYRKNFETVVVASYTPFFIFFTIFYFSELALLIAIFALPLFGIYLYVSYRHVYLGKRENSPARIESTVADTSPT